MLQLNHVTSLLYQQINCIPRHNFYVTIGNFFKVKKRWPLYVFRENTDNPNENGNLC